MNTVFVKMQKYVYTEFTVYDKLIDLYKGNYIQVDMKCIQTGI